MYLRSDLLRAFGAWHVSYTTFKCFQWTTGANLQLNAAVIYIFERKGTINYGLAKVVDSNVINIYYIHLRLESNYSNSSATPRSEASSATPRSEAWQKTLKGEIVPFTLLTPLYCVKMTKYL